MSSPIFPLGYAHWLAPRLTKEKPETLATCDTCAMVNPQGLTRDRGPFLNHLKCCTYFPFIPNFSLGALTSEKIALALEKGLLLPVGIYPSASYQQLLEEIGASGFGRREELLCPFYSSSENRCSIWANRPGVCTSYFCKSDTGKPGLEFWKDVEKYLNHFEWQMACHIMSQLGLGENELAYCQAAVAPDTEDDEREYFINAAWGKWNPKRYEFFSEARRLSLQISSEDLAKILAPEFLSLEKKLSK